LIDGTASVVIVFATILFLLLVLSLLMLIEVSSLTLLLLFTLLLSTVQTLVSTSGINVPNLRRGLSQLEIGASAELNFNYYQLTLCHNSGGRNVDCSLLV
jgi:hypothetical protein